MLKRHEVEILLKAGHGKSEVARLAGVSLCSVKRIAAEAATISTTGISLQAPATRLHPPSRPASPPHWL